MPAVVCDGWAGCASARGNEQDGWFVERSEKVPRGSETSVDRVALPKGASATVFRLAPEGVICPPHTVPPILPRLDFDCSADCRATPKR